MAAILTLMRGVALRAPVVTSSPRLVALPLPLLRRKQRSAVVALAAGDARSPPRASSSRRLRVRVVADQSPTSGSLSRAAPRDSESHLSHPLSPLPTAAGALSCAVLACDRRSLSLSSASTPDSLDAAVSLSRFCFESLGSLPCGSVSVEFGAFGASAFGRRALPVSMHSCGVCAPFVLPARVAPTPSRRLHSLLASARRGVGASESPDTRVAAVGARRFSSSSAAQSTVERPPSVTSKILACERERAKLRKEAPFLTVMPSEWTKAKVKEFQDAKIDIQVRLCLFALSRLLCSRL